MTLLRPNFAVLFAFILFSANVLAADTDEMTQKVCAKVKTCGIAEIEKQSLSPDMKSMMEKMFDSMCTSIVAPYIVQTQDAGLESKAEACLESMQALSCEKIIDGGADNSEACVAFEKAAKEAGIDTNTTTIIQ